MPVTINLVPLHTLMLYTGQHYFYLLHCLHVLSRAESHRLITIVTDYKLVTN